MAKSADLRPKVERQLREYARRRVWADGLSSVATGAIGIPMIALMIFGALLLVLVIVTNSLPVASWFVLVGAGVIHSVSASADPVSPTFVAALLALAVINTGRVAGSLVASAAGWIANLSVTWATLSLSALALPGSAEPDLRGERALTAVILAFVAVVLSALIRQLLPFSLAERKARLERTLTATVEKVSALRQWMLLRAVRSRLGGKPPGNGGIRRRSDVVVVAVWLLVVIASSVALGFLATNPWAGVMTALVSALMFGTVLVMLATTLRGTTPRGLHWLGLLFVLVYGLAAAVCGIALPAASRGQSGLAISAATFSVWAVLTAYAWLAGFTWWSLWPNWTPPAIAVRLQLDWLKQRRRQLAKLRRAVTEAKTDTP